MFVNMSVCEHVSVCECVYDFVCVKVCVYMLVSV